MKETDSHIWTFNTRIDSVVLIKFDALYVRRLTPEYSLHPSYIVDANDFLIATKISSWQAHYT